MRPLSILFLFVAVAFIMYSSFMIYGATRGSSPVDFFMGETRDEKGESSPEAHSSEIFNLTTPNDSVVAPTILSG